MAEEKLYISFIYQGRSIYLPVSREFYTRFGCEVDDQIEDTVYELPLKLHTDLSKQIEEEIEKYQNSFAGHKFDPATGKVIPPDMVNHPAHYGGLDNPYEACKVIEAWDLGWHLGSAIKYVARAGKKDPAKEKEDLEKAIWYIQRRISTLPEKASS